jgi:site-specific recombinase XerD
MLKVKKAHKEFIKHLKNKGRSPATLLSYDRHLEDLIDFLEKLKKDHVRHVTKKDLYRFITYLKNKGYTKKSIAAKATTAKTFFKFLEINEYITTNPAVILESIKQETKGLKPRILSTVEYRALRDIARKDVRNYAIVELLLQTGIKIGELARIGKRDVSFKKGPAYGQLAIRNTKGKIERAIPLNNIAERAIKDYLRVRPKTKEEILFVTKTGHPLLIRNIRVFIKMYYKKAGITNAKVHDLRHTFCAHHLKKGTSLLIVAKMAGHKKLATTEKYLSLIEKEKEDQIEKNAL